MRGRPFGLPVPSPLFVAAAQPLLPMTISSPSSSRLRAALSLVSVGFFLVAFAARAADATGEITGAVSNAATGKLLEGAKVEVPATGAVVLTDDTGRYHLIGVPAGQQEIVVSYLGLDAMKATVAVAAGQRATRNFDLTSAIYQLDTFKVTGEREGQASAITAQRNAANVKNVVAIDAFGNLPNMNASELAVLLPGVAGNVNDEGNLNAMTIRGIGAGLNTITIDGALMGSQGGMQRQTRIHTITGSMFEQLELIKGHTPDKGMDSLGGSINLKSRSPLALRERSQTSYNFSARMAPPGTEQIPMREAHRTHPLLNVSHQQVFDAFKGDRNLGVALNFFYSEQAVGYFSTTRDYQSNNAAGTPAYLWDYNTQDNYNNRKQSSVNAKVDFRLSANTKLSLNTIYNDAMERFRLRYSLRLFTGNATTAPSATSGIVPGFTDRITDVRATAGSTVDITSQMSQFYHRQRHISFEVEHEYGPLKIDYGTAFSLDHINSSGGDGGVLVNRLTNVGWRIDRTASDLYPRVIQTAGPSWSNPANYRPNSFNFADTKQFHEPKEARVNFLYTLPTTQPLAVKTGFRWRQEESEDRGKSRRYNFTGTNSAQLPTDPSIQTFGDHKTGLSIPAWNANAIARGRTPLDPNLWTEDRYFAEQNRYTGTRAIFETVNAAYVMVQGRLGHTGYLAGAREEWTKDDSWGWVRVRTPSTPAQQLADPVGSAARDYGARRELHGDYSKLFPSAHLTHDFTANLKGRLSWSTSYGRAPMNSYLPNETPNEAARTLTINNPSLKPQVSKNWDATIDYYIEPVGSLSVGWFHKTIRDYFVSASLGRVGTGADNGYGGEYAGFELFSQNNVGTAYIQGWELSYQQQFTFLPGLLKGLGVSFNHTLLDTHGNFGGSVVRSTGAVAGFIPRTTNASLSWRYQRFGTRVNLNRTGTYLRNFTAAGSGANQYTRERTIVNIGAAYQLRPALSLTIDVQNVFNEPQSWYRGVPDNLSQFYMGGTTITAGISGRF